MERSESLLSTMPAPQILGQAEKREILEPRSASGFDLQLELPVASPQPEVTEFLGARE